MESLHDSNMRQRTESAWLKAWNMPTLEDFADIPAQRVDWAGYRRAVQRCEAFRASGQRPPETLRHDYRFAHLFD